MERAGDADTNALPSVPGTVPQPAPEEAEEYFNSFAETYLLNNADLTDDLGDVSDALEAAPSKLAAAEANGAEHAKDQDGLLQFDWEQSDPAPRTSGEPSWNMDHGKPELRSESLAVADKARLDTTGDSSEWEQTHGSLPMVTQADSPESVLMGGRSKVGFKEEGLQGTAQMQAASGAFSSQDPFAQRMPAGDAHRELRTSLSQPLFTSRFADYPLLENEPLDAISTPMGWDRRGLSETGFYNSPADSEWRHHSQRGLWGDPSSDPAGGMERDVARGGSLRGDTPIYRMRSDMSGMPFRERFLPTRRQFSADLSYDGGHNRSMDVLGGHMDPGFEPAYHSAPMADSYGRPVRMGGMNQQSHGYYSPRVAPGGEPQHEGSRKRAREAYLQSTDVGLPPQQLQQERAPMAGQVRSSPRIQARMKQRLTYEEQLIGSLKRQIYHLDPTTKAVLKESLYRISRNTNARAAGMPDAQQHRMPTRNSFVDRVVANLMYNRFQTPPVRSSTAHQQGSGQWMHDQPFPPTVGGGHRAGGSPGMRMNKGEGSSLHLEESPNA